MENMIAVFIRKLKGIAAVILALLGIGVVPPTPPAGEVIEQIDGNLLSLADSTFEGGTTLEAVSWSVFGGGELSLAEGENGGTALRLSKREGSWYSPSLDIFDYIQANGAGVYTLGASLFLEGKPKDELICGQVLRGTRENSFITSDMNGEFYFRMKYVFAPKTNCWLDTQLTLTVTEGDLAEADRWLYCLDLLTPEVEAIRIDNAYLKKAAEFDSFSEELVPSECECLRAAEMLLISDKSYANPLFDNETQIVFTHSDGTVLSVPGFWDGENLWRFRFALTKEGEWNYETRCTDAENPSLVRSGAILCKPYSGDLPIYRHGFVDIKDGNRYFTYADGTPFFYLGDTHWTMPTEEYYSSGENSGDVETDSHFKHIVKTRAEQGFTVYQSQPIDAAYNLHNGFDGNDIEGFRDLDRRFAYIADCGLVHANSQLLFTSELSNYPESYSEAYLEKLSRYWVARYSAYPVLWTTAQECDNDFYFSRGDQSVFTAQSNPWKAVLRAVSKYDPYNHPGSAHMEYSSFDEHGTIASSSSFREVDGHNWYAVQWSPSLNGFGNNFEISRDYWYNGQNKVIINYEGRYENLWTKNFGARAQGWISYLSGMYGYGYGCEDIWYYKSSYDIQDESNDGVDKITTADKKITWSEALELKTPAELKHLRNFLEANSWSTLVPRFDDEEWVSFGKRGYGVLASDGNDTYVAYFYGKSTVISTTVKGLDNCAYTKQWFNPRTGEYKKPCTVSPVGGKLHIASKPDGNDWVLIIKKK